MADETEKSKSKNGLAKDRTDFAEDRTLMANERTFAGWMRTGLACLGLALGFQAVFGKIEPVWLPKLVASGFAVIAVLIFFSAYRQARKVFHRMNSHKFETSSRNHLRLLCGIMILGAIAVASGIWYFDWTT
ncbi:YidH family protein [Litorimonas haliclonae]|uniref:YidH family protein n=1 Tax=Litorimonas haliclonae TaxID=2081977 RepID=UPI0039EE4C7E